jgi:hypothetical protein
MSPARILLIPVLAAVALTAAEKPSGLPRSSPFLPAGTSGAPAEAAAESIEFAGIYSTVGKRTDLIFHDKTTKKNHWIAPGETKGGIAVISYDEVRQLVVVKLNGAEKTLALRKVASPKGGAPRPVAPQPTGFNVPTPPPQPAAPSEPVVITPGTGNGSAGITISAAPAAPAAPEAPEATRVRQETEARMLVSDLLEIGMAQRKAYEDAQRRAASGENPTPPTTPAAPQ